MSSRKRSSPRTGPSSFKRTKRGPSPRTVSISKRSVHEVKVKHESFAQSNFTDQTLLWAIKGPAAGDADDQREGRMVQSKGIEFRGIFTLHPGRTAANFRLIIGVWKQASTVLQNGMVLDGYLGSSPTDFLCPINQAYSSSLVILYDQVHHLEASPSTAPAPSGTGAIVSGGNSKAVVVNKFYGGRQEFFDNTENSFTNWNYFYMIANSGTAEVDSLTKVTTRFIDI